MVKIIFLIDDDDDDREIFRDALLICDEHIQLIFATDGLEALQILHAGANHPDVIFLDYNMPKMNGLECLKALKADPATKFIPLIMYSTSGNPEHENLVLQYGASYYMRKALTFHQTCAELKRLLELVSTNGEVSSKNAFPS
jgi:CheY-like chemotaxis protein